MKQLSVVSSAIVACDYRFVKWSICNGSNPSSKKKWEPTFWLNYSFIGSIRTGFQETPHRETLSIGIEYWHVDVLHLLNKARPGGKIKEF